MESAPVLFENPRDDIPVLATRLNLLDDPDQVKGHDPFYSWSYSSSQAPPATNRTCAVLTGSACEERQ
jgi:hypothetical protein